ncbi:MAG: phytoene/squalene synthase family protein [Eubacteriales bacterium]|nr:phytoene/squalene synthase family protein [Eubacteriales bacterium]
MAEAHVPVELLPDVAWCEAIIRRHSGSFYRSFKRLPAGRAAAVFAVYAFCRLADDSIDVDHDPAQLDQLEARLHDFAADKIPDEPLWRLLRWAFTTYQLEIGPFFEMIEGQRRDITFAQPKTNQDLWDYCYLVAGTVGLMILPLLASPVTAVHRRLAVDLGQAMQMSNILRDLAADYRQGRIYLPAQELAARGILVDDFGLARPTEALKSYWLELAHDALQRYEGVRQNLVSFDTKARLPVLLALLYYSHITLLGIRNPDQVLARRLVVPDPVKYWLYLKARWNVWTLKLRTEV